MLLNDYADGLRSLGPVLAAWESARQSGALIDLPAFLGEQQQQGVGAAAEQQQHGVRAAVEAAAAVAR